VYVTDLFGQTNVVAPSITTTTAFALSELSRGNTKIKNTIRLRACPNFPAKVLNERKRAGGGGQISIVFKKM
jgi:hypothetical protein